MFIDCTECGTHVIANATDRTLHLLDLSEPVLCDACAAQD